MHFSRRCASTGSSSCKPRTIHRDRTATRKTCCGSDSTTGTRAASTAPRSRSRNPPRRSNARSRWRRDLFGAEIESARLVWLRHQSKTTTELAAEADAGASKLLAGNAPEAQLIRLAASAELLLGRVAFGRGDAAAAGRYRQQALTRMQAVAAHSSDPRDIAIMAEALLATGDETRARKNLARLSATGYASADFIMRLHAQGIGYAPNATVSERIARTMKAAPADSTVAKPTSK